MIKILIIVFICVLVVALLGVVVFLFKKNQSGNSISTENKAPDLRINPNAMQRDQQQLGQQQGQMNQANQQMEQAVPQGQFAQQEAGNQQGQVSPQMAQSPVSNNQAMAQNALLSAQGFIEQQRYDEAEATLKKGLQVQPDDNGLALKLLNVYALTSNQNSFQEVFAKVIANGDVQSIKQAEQIKSLLDSDIAAKSTMQSPVDPAVASQPSVAEPSLDLDFDSGIDFNPEPVETTLEMPSPATSSVDDGLSLDMDGFNFDSNVNTDNGSDSLDGLGDISDMTGGLDSLESSLLADNNSLNSGMGNDTAKATAPTEEASNFDFDLSLDSTDASTNEPIAAIAEDSDLSLDFDAGLSLETPSTTPATETNTQSDLGLDLQLGDLETAANTDKSSGDDLSIDSFDLNIDEPTLEPTDSIGDDLADFSLEKGAGIAVAAGAVATSGALQTETNATETTEATTEAEDGFDFDFDGLDTDLSDADLSIDTPVETAIETPVVETTELADDFELSDFGLEDDLSAELGSEDLATDLSIAPSTETVTKTATEPTADIDEFSFDDFGLEEASLEKADTEVTPVVEEPSIDFNIDEPAVEEVKTEEANFDFDTVDLSIDDGLSLDESGITDTANLSEDLDTAPPAVAPTLDTTDTTADTTSPVVSEDVPSNKMPAEITAEFSVLEELDSHQVTLDLATQYLDLGEYDSAKRLLQEVMDNGTDEQVQKAQNILAQAG